MCDVYNLILACAPRVSRMPEIFKTAGIHADT